MLVAGRFVKRDGEIVGVDINRAADLASGASERVSGRIADQGQPLLPAAPPGFADAINTMAAQTSRALTVVVAP